MSGVRSVLHKYLRAPSAAQTPLMAGKVLLIVALAAVLGTASASESKAIMTAILNMFHGIGNAEYASCDGDGQHART